MTQDIDTQTILDNLEKVIENRDRWYEPFEYSWRSLASGFFTYRYFFPKEIANEIRKITRYVWFPSEEVFYTFIQRACPLIYSQIERWKLLTELKDYSREVRIAKK